ncbi:MAG: J domain-containing protein [Rhizobacter sp.]
MTQPTLFPEDDPAIAQPLALVGVPGSATALSKGQKRFNKLVADIQAQRLLLAQWREFSDAHQARVASEFVPLQDQLHHKRVAMAKVLDQALLHPSLGKTHRAKIQDILQNLLGELVMESDDPELVALHDKHSEMSLQEMQADDMELTQAFASDFFGMDLDGHDAQTPEELAQQIQQKLHERAQLQEDSAHEKKPTRKKSAKTMAAEEKREQAAQAATQSLREVYRKLASALHPDREPDAMRRDQKTALMKRVNTAYEASDLLALLELQLEIEQIDTEVLAGLSDERVQHFNVVLADQLKQLQEELFHTTQPFAAMLTRWGRQSLSPAMVQRVLDDDLKDLNHTLQQVQADLERFQDIKQLKASLRNYRIERQDDDMDMLDFILMNELQRR